MSTTIDNRVVEMRFDNKQFEIGVQTSIDTLEKLKQSLKLEGASKGLDGLSKGFADVNSSIGKTEGVLDRLKRAFNLDKAVDSLSEVDSASKKFDGHFMMDAIEGIKIKFSGLEVMGVTALMNLTNAAINAGKNIASAFTIEPVKTGMTEYETQINAVQTILANTKKEKTNVETVNKALDELNTYADKTIYNFTEMTRNIGTFTAAGVKLDDSVTAIKGIANLAAVSGSTSQQASTAMYQLSQALSSGTLKLQDWNSVVNAGMGGQVFQDALKETAKVHNINVDAMIEKEGSFRETLKTGWITTEILTETLAKFTGDLSDAQLKQMGYTDKQIASIQDMAKTANEAATKVKTFTQLMDTLKEAAQSGWAQSWRIIIGDFEEAKMLWTEISDELGSIIGASADNRNKILQEWRDLGGRKNVIDSLRNAFEALKSVIAPIKESFREIFPAITAKQLLTLTEKLKTFTSNLKIGDETAGRIKRTFKGLFSVFSIFKKVLSAVTKVIGNVLGSDGMGTIGDTILDITARIGDALTYLNDNLNFDGAVSTLSSVLSGIANFAGGILNIFKAIVKTIEPAVNFIVGAAAKIGESLGKVFQWITKNISISDVFAGLIGGTLYTSVDRISNGIDTVIKSITDFFKKADTSSKGIRDDITSVLNSLHDALISLTTGIKVSSLVSMAVAVSLLTSSVKKLSELSVTDIVKSVTSIGVMLGMLSGALRKVTKALSKFKSKGVIKAGLAMMFMAEAVKILADACKKFSELSWEEIAKGLVGTGIAIGELVVGVKILGTTKIKMKTVISMIALAEAVKILADACTKLAVLSWEEIAKGLTAMGGAFVELVAAIKIIGKTKVKLKTVVAMLGLAKSVEMLSESLQKLGKMDWGEIGRGLTAMGGALAELVGSIAILKKVGGFKSLFGSAAILMVISGLDELSNALIKFGSMSWSEVGRGLSAMGGALLEVCAACGLLGKLAGFSGIIGGVEIRIVIDGLNELSSCFIKFAKMSWSEVGRGLSAMGGALLEIGTVSGALGYLTNFAGILGAATIWVAVQGLDDLANALIKFGSMDWGEIGRGLTAMGGALTELAVGGFLNTLSAIGAVAITEIADSLGELADALYDFGSMSWSEIGRGLTAMAGALGETGLFGILNSFSGLGALSLEKIVWPLDELANVLIKFGSLSWEEVKNGLTAMAGALSETAIGGIINTFSGIGANAISEMAEPLGVLADSVKKWADVTVPEDLPKSLKMLAQGVGSFIFKGFGADALAETAEPLGVLAESAKKWAGVSIPEDLPDMIGKLAKGVGKFTFQGAFGADTLSEVATPLGVLADSAKKWTDVTVPSELPDNLEALAKGVGKFAFKNLGANGLSIVAEPLGKLADSVKKWEDVEVSSSIGYRLNSLGTAIQKFSFSFLGGFSINSLIDPLKKLPESIKAWKDVTLPETLITDLTDLSTGIKEFSWAFMGGWSLSSLVNPLGSLADSMRKWKGVKVPSTIKTDLENISTGVKSFSFGFVGGLTFKSVAGSMNTLATAVQQFSQIKIEDGLGEKLTNFGDDISTFAEKVKPLATAPSDDINKFSDAIKLLNLSINGLSTINSETITSFISSINQLASLELESTSLSEFSETLSTSLNSIMQPLKELSSESIIDSLSRLPDAINKWNGVAIPEGLGDKLTEIGESIDAFPFMLTSGWSISSIIEPLGSLAESVNKWKGVKVPSTIKTDLENISTGVKSFSFGFVGGLTFKSVAEPISILATAVQKFSQIKIEDGLGKKLTDFGDSISALSEKVKGIDKKDSSDVNLFSTSITKLNTSVNSISEVDSVKINTFIEAIEKLASLDIDATTLTTLSTTIYRAIAVIVKAISTNIENGKSSITEATKTAMSGITSGIESKTSSVKSATAKLVSVLSKSVSAKKANITSAFKTLVSGAANGIESHKTSFSNAGGYLGDGLVSGINSKKTEVYNAAYALGQAAVQGEKDGQKSNSPSKLTIQNGKWFGEGLVIGINKMSDKVYAAGYDIGDTAVKSLSSSISGISDAITFSEGYTPTIKPVVDMSSVKASKLELNADIGMSMNRSIESLSQIVTRSQYEIDRSNQEVVSAIKGLREDINAIYDGEDQEIGLYIDGKKLASSIAKQMNRQLNILSKRGSY